jgi:tetratricopeptide (TPR) repeat protein
MMIRYLMITAFLLAPIAPAFAGEQLDAAIEHFKAGRYAEAADAAEEVGEQPEDEFARSRYLMGQIQLVLGEPQKAEGSFRAALKKRRASAAILTGLGRAQLALEDNDGAVQSLSAAVKADAKSAQARAFFGIAVYRASAGLDGKKDIDAGMRLGRKDPEVVRAIVKEWVEAGELPRARKAAQTFRKANKKHPVGPFLAAIIAEQDEKFDDAIELYEKAIALDGNFIDAHKNLAILCIAQNPVYTNTKRTTLAMKHFDLYFKLGGKDAQVQQIYNTLQKFIKIKK